MQPGWYFYLFSTLAGAALALALAIYGWRRRAAPGMAPFTALALGSAVWAAGSAVEALSPALEGKLLWARVEYLGIVVIPPAWLAFALDYTRCAGRAVRSSGLVSKTLLSGRLFSGRLFVPGIPAATLGVIFTNEQHHLFWRAAGLEWHGGLAVLRPVYGPWFWLHAGFSYCLLAAGAGVLARRLLRGPPLYRRQAAVVLLALAVPWLANLVYISGATPVRADFTPAAFALAALGLIWGRHRLSLLDIVPVARDAVIERMPDGVVVLDLAGHVVDLNPAAERMLGRPAASALGRPAQDVLAPLDCVALLASAAAEARAEVTVGDGPRRRVYDALLSPLHDGRGRPAGRLLVFRDITALKRVEEELLRARRLEMAGQVAAQVAHDVNNLLGPLLNLPQLIKRSLPPEHPAVRYCDLLIAAVHRLRDINRDLLALGRRGVAGDERCELTQVVRDTLSQIVLPPAVSLELRLPPEELLVRGAPAQLSRVLQNLITNALEAMDQAGRLTISAEVVTAGQDSAGAPGAATGTYVRICVSDTGAGIAPELHDRIFEPFFSTKRADQRRGTGLGLSIVQAIVRDYGGFITVQSAPGAGATFAIHLPLAAAPAPATPLS